MLNTTNASGTNTFCFACADLLIPVMTPVIPDGTPDDAKFNPYNGQPLYTDVQFKDAIAVRFNGGYGMYCDPWDVELEVVICKHCADNLFDLIPWVKKLLNHFLDFEEKLILTMPKVNHPSNKDFNPKTVKGLTLIHGGDDIDD